MRRIEALCAGLDRAGIKYIRNALLRDYCTFRIGGPAAVMAFPASDREIYYAVSRLRERGEGCFVLGNGSNVLFSDDGYAGLIVSTGALGSIEVVGEEIVAGCGASLARIALAAARAGLSGCEFMYGIPGSCGGAVYMNAGAYGSQMSDIIVSIDCLNMSDGSVSSLLPGELDFAYRHSVFSERKNLVILRARLRLSPGVTDDIESKMKEHMRARREKQPLEYPSAGSVFKRRPGYYMGKLIEDCGLKGFAVGGAAVSDKHAGFIVNTGGATAADVLELVSHIKETILREYGFEPECEIVMPGGGRGR